MEVSRKERILVVAEKKREVYGGLIKALSKEYSVKEWYAVSDPDNPPSILARWLSVIKAWGAVFKKFKPAKVVICGGSLISLWIVVFLIRSFRLKVEIILFRYDIEYFYVWPSKKGFNENLNHFIALMMEKFCMLRADKILHKGLKNELEFLPFYRKIKDKPHYLFREFLDKKLIQKSRQNAKLSRKDAQPHLVYIGGLYFNNFPTIESFWTFYPKITSQKIHLHIYSKQPEGIVRKLRETEKRDKYFHYEGYRKHEDLVKELTKYDYGVHIFGTGMPKKAELVYKTAFSNKNYDYLSAGLPIIASNNLGATNEFVINNKIGFCIEYKDMSKLKDKIASDMVYYSKNIKRFIKKYDASNLLKFIGS
ncbi:glycosyltransferase [Candidatus Woesearchaeota archaeon]|nr:glycosyltransferase [Candidatus Woesearchaeota archaeon]